MAGNAPAPANPTVFLYTEGAAVPRDVTNVKIELVEVEFCEGLQTIGEMAFRSCTSLRSIHIPSTVEDISLEAFAYCTSLTEVELCKGLGTIEDSAFRYCLSLSRISIPSTIRDIPDRAFTGCSNLTEVELREGLRTIGEYAFACCKSLAHITIPSTVTEIGNEAFDKSGLISIDLPDSITSIGNRAFRYCKLVSFRMPPLVEVVPNECFRYCRTLMSTELPAGSTMFDSDCFTECCRLRNMAAKGITMRHSLFTRYQDLEQLFGTDRGVQEALMNRFVGRPVHEICYYHSYHPVETTLEKLQNKIIQQLTDNHQQQDIFGMTPLHILACSKRQSLDLYRLVVEHFPNDLICKDKWGEIPIFYALWSIAPDEIVQFLIESIKAAHPQYELDWKGLLKDFVVNGASMEVVERVVSVQQAYFPEAKMDWVNGLDEILQQQRDRVLPKIKKLVFKLIVKTRVESLSKEEWRQDITTQINALPIGANDRSLDSLVGETHSNLEHYEMVDATSLLELAVWKMKIDEQTASNSNSDESHQIRANVDNIEFREVWRVSCGIDSVMKNVVPFLLPVRNTD
eukprot:scaffold5368_cov206-Alexandrium_tamarense.AAC.6